MTTPKTALITGVTGQDCAYLAAFLLEKGYQVHGDMTDSPNLTENDRPGGPQTVPCTEEPIT